MTKTLCGLGTTLALTACLAGCGRGQEDSGTGTCTYDGKVYTPGTTFPALDGCNECWCSPPKGVVCTAVRCALDADRPDTAVSCPWGDGSVPVGHSVPDPDPCKECTCMSGGTIGCNDRHPVCTKLDAPVAHQDAANACTLPTSVVFGSNGGMVAYQDQYSLAATGTLTITRTNYGRGAVDAGAVRGCAPPLPACGASGVVSIANIAADLAAADVQAAFKTGTPLFGIDPRPYDGTVYSIALGSGGTILVGQDCAASGGTSCVPIPAALKRLADDLKGLASAALATPECKDL